jgi:hypothetical protein
MGSQTALGVLKNYAFMDSVRIDMDYPRGHVYEVVDDKKTSSWRKI